MTYRSMEEQGIASPVIGISSRYHHPARYDDLIELETWVQAYNGVRLTMGYAVRCEGRLFVRAKASTPSRTRGGPGAQAQLPSSTISCLPACRRIARWRKKPTIPEANRKQPTELAIANTSATHRPNKRYRLCRLPSTRVPSITLSRIRSVQPDAPASVDELGNAPSLAIAIGSANWAACRTTDVRWRCCRPGQTRCR
jgi:hypothetical protein